MKIAGILFFISMIVIAVFNEPNKISLPFAIGIGMFITSCLIMVIRDVTKRRKK